MPLSRVNGRAFAAGAVHLDRLETAGVPTAAPVCQPGGEARPPAEALSARRESVLQGGRVGHSSRPRRSTSPTPARRLGHARRHGTIHSLCRPAAKGSCAGIFSVSSFFISSCRAVGDTQSCSVPRVDTSRRSVTPQHQRGVRVCCSLSPTCWRRMFRSPPARGEER